MGSRSCDSPGYLPSDSSPEPFCCHDLAFALAWLDPFRVHAHPSSPVHDRSVRRSWATIGTREGRTGHARPERGVLGRIARGTESEGWPLLLPSRGIVWFGDFELPRPNRACEIEQEQAPDETP